MQRSQTLSTTSVYTTRAFSTSYRRLATSEASNRPASENVPRAAQEEAAAVASTLAQGIAGVGGKGSYDLASVTRPQVAGDKSSGEGLSLVTA